MVECLHKARPFQGLLTKHFLWDVQGKLCSKFGEDQSKTEFAILAVITGWRDTGWTPNAKVILYSVQCCTLHWTDNKRNFLWMDGRTYIDSKPLRTTSSHSVVSIDRWHCCGIYSARMQYVTQKNTNIKNTCYTCSTLSF